MNMISEILRPTVKVMIYDMGIGEFKFLLVNNGGKWGELSVPQGIKGMEKQVAKEAISKQFGINNVIKLTSVPEQYVRVNTEKYANSFPLHFVLANVNSSEKLNTTAQAKWVTLRDINVVMDNNDDRRRFLNIVRYLMALNRIGRAY